MEWVILEEDCWYFHLSSFFTTWLHVCMPDLPPSLPPSLSPHTCCWLAGVLSCSNVQHTHTQWTLLLLHDDSIHLKRLICWTPALSPQHLHHRETASAGAEDPNQVRRHRAPLSGREAERAHEPAAGQSHHHQRAAGQGPAEEREHEEVSAGRPDVLQRFACNCW